LPFTYEFPLSERIRTWLRLEELFDKARFFVGLDNPRAHHAALLSIFELGDVTARPELKSELIQELDRQRVALENLRSNPAVDPGRLDSVLAEIAAVLAGLHGMSGKVGQHIRDNDWLMGIKGRTGLPGGVCGFDVPCYLYWLNSPVAERVTDLNAWLAPLQPIQRAVAVVLRILRESGQPQRHMAQGGLFQLSLGGRAAQMVRLEVVEGMACAPEISANKYAINIRFVQPDKSQKPRPCTQDVGFALTLCSF